MKPLVVSIAARSFGELARRALAAAPTADVVELRLDSLPNVEERELAALLARLGRPAIAAVHGPEAYGAFQGSAARRVELLARAARAGAAYVDVEWRLAPELPPLGGSARRIVSRHERAGAKPPAELARELRAATKPGDLVKLAVEARDGCDALEVLALLADAKGDLIALASGAAGSFTRVLAPILGSPLTYASQDAGADGAGAPTAPGQLPASALRAAWPAAGPSASTAIFAVVGQDVARSISPRVHAEALRALGLDAVFVALSIPDLPRALASLSAANWRGLAVTAPHKRAAFELARRRDHGSERARACNTLVRAPDGWSGANTDVDGVRGALTTAGGEEWKGRRGLVLGAGGAARAALTALETLGAQRSVAARDDAQAAELAREFGAEALLWSQREARAFEALVNCTPVGSRDEAPLVGERALRPGMVVLDAVYAPRETPLLELARRRGCTLARGADWFRFQAQRQFELLTGRAPPAGVIGQEVERALA